MFRNYILILLSGFLLCNFCNATYKISFSSNNSSSEKSIKAPRLKFWEKKSKEEAILDSNKVAKATSKQDTTNIEENLDVRKIETMIDSLGIFDNHKMKKDFLQLRQSILNLMNFNDVSGEMEMLTFLYDLNKRTNALEQEFITKSLGNIGDDTVIPMLMEIANNNNLPIEIRSNAVEILSKKQSPELVDFLIEMLGDPHSKGKVNEFALNVMGDLSEERMIMALLESYRIGRSKYYSLLNTFMNSLNNFENPEIIGIYQEIARSKDFPSKIRVKAFKSLIRFSDSPGTIEQIIELLNDPENYKYYEEIISLLQNTGAYENHKTQLRIAAYKAMQNDLAPLGIKNE